MDGWGLLLKVRDVKGYFDCIKNMRHPVAVILGDFFFHVESIFFYQVSGEKI